MAAAAAVMAPLQPERGRAWGGKGRMARRQTAGAACGGAGEVRWRRRAAHEGLV